MIRSIPWILLVVTTTTFFWSCSTGQSSSSECETYLSKIPSLTLPFSKQCNDDYAMASIERSDSLVQKFKPEGAAVLGKFAINNNLIGIIYTFPADVILPILHIYDTDGEKHSDLRLIANYCGRDYDFYSSSYFKIENDFTIIRIDSTITYSLDATDEIIGVKTSEVVNKTYTISDLGIIQERK